MNPINKACEVFGSQKKLADALGVTPGAVCQWATGRVPVDRCIDIERLTNRAVRCEDLRPDIDWHYLRATDCDIKQAA